MVGSPPTLSDTVLIAIIVGAATPVSLFLVGMVYQGFRRQATTIADLAEHRMTRIEGTLGDVQAQV